MTVAFVEGRVADCTGRDCNVDGQQIFREVKAQPQEQEDMVPEL